MSCTKADTHVIGSAYHRQEFNVQKWCICLHLMNYKRMFEMTYGLGRKSRNGGDQTGWIFGNNDSAYAQ